jgi:hypothetical protein
MKKEERGPMSLFMMRFNFPAHAKASCINSLVFFLQKNKTKSYGAVGKQAEALGLKEKVVALQQGSLGEGHPDTLVSQFNLSVAYEQAGRLDEAVACCGTAAEGMRAALGPRHPYSVQFARALKDLERRKNADGGKEEKKMKKQKEKF